MECIPLSSLLFHSSSSPSSIYTSPFWRRESQYNSVSLRTTEEPSITFSSRRVFFSSPGMDSFREQFLSFCRHLSAVFLSLFSGSLFAKVFHLKTIFPEFSEVFRSIFLNDHPPSSPGCDPPSLSPYRSLFVLPLPIPKQRESPFKCDDVWMEKGSAQVEKSDEERKRREEEREWNHPTCSRLSPGYLLSLYSIHSSLSCKVVLCSPKVERIHEWKGD